MFEFVSGAAGRACRARVSARRMASAKIAAMIKGASGRPTAPAEDARNERQHERERQQRLFKRQKARSKSLAEQPDERDGDQRQIVVEQERAREQAGADDRGGLRRRPKGAPLKPPERGDDGERTSRSALPRRARATHAAGGPRRTRSAFSRRRPDCSPAPSGRTGESAKKPAHVGAPNAASEAAENAAAVAAATISVVQRRAKMSANGTTKARCGLNAIAPKRTPASAGLASIAKRPPPISAALRKPFCPWAALTNTAGKARNATGSSDGR